MNLQFIILAFLTAKIAKKTANRMHIIAHQAHNRIAYSMIGFINV